MTTKATLKAPLAILLVEEDDDQRALIATHLAEAGFEVWEADTADEAMALLRGAGSLCGLVTNARLPGTCDGADLVCEVRERFPQAALVITSGHSDAVSGPVPEGSAFVNKPNLLEHLVPLLRRMIAGTGQQA